MDARVEPGHDGVCGASLRELMPRSPAGAAAQAGVPKHKAGKERPVGSVSVFLRGEGVVESGMDKKRTFAVVLEPEDEGGFTVRVPAFPEIVTYGADEADALAMAEDAIRLVVEDSLARGEPLPTDAPSRIRQVTVTLAA